MAAKLSKQHPPKPLKQLTWPQPFNAFAKPEPNSPAFALIIEHAPKPKELQWYPDLPKVEAAIWAIWSNGKYGYAKFEGGWTFRAANGEFVNETPIAWHLA
jgi:hypothetical protein